MPRLTISLSQPMHNHLSALAAQQDNASLSQVFNQLLQLGIRSLNDSEPTITTPIDTNKAQIQNNFIPWFECITM